MNYEVEQALSRKVDEWRFNSLEQTVDRQKYEIKDLSHKVDQLEGSIRNHYYVIEQLITKLIEKFPEEEYEFTDIKRNL